MGNALITDFYELNMAASYLRRDMVGPATFSLFVRRLPPSRGFLVAAGLEDCLKYLESFAFGPDDLAWLGTAGFPADVIDMFEAMHFSGDVIAVPEGRVVFADEPLLEVTAPIAEAQLVETYLLNQITYQTSLATKATRCRLAAGGIELVDFALRRTHGAEAGMAVARVSAIAGFGATSNVEAARRFGLEAAGTMAHSYIEAFPTEAKAFRAFAEDLPGRTTFLVDTYDTRAGVEAAIGVIRQLGLSGPLGVRLDSGDLARLARETREQLDGAGLPDVRIFVSGGLDEYDLERFRMDRRSQLTPQASAPRWACRAMPPRSTAPTSWWRLGNDLCSSCPPGRPHSQGPSRCGGASRSWRSAWRRGTSQVPSAPSRCSSL